MSNTILFDASHTNQEWKKFLKKRFEKRDRTGGMGGMEWRGKEQKKKDLKYKAAICGAQALLINRTLNGCVLAQINRIIKKP